MNEQVRKRQIERHCAATIRALSGHPRAEYRRELLFEDGRGVDLYSPHLAADVVNHSLERCRGIADAMALRLEHTDFELHRSLQPKDEIGRMVFDILEQMRAESLAPKDMKGLQRNLDRAFHEWCRESRRSGLTENELGLLIYSVIQVVRARLVSEQQEEEVEDLIESTRFKLAPLIGDQLAQLHAMRFDQAAYAKLALTISSAVSEMARAAAGEDLDHEVSKTRHRLLMPRQHESDDRYVEGGAAGAIPPGATHQPPAAARQAGFRPGGQRPEAGTAVNESVCGVPAVWLEFRRRRGLPGWASLESVGGKFQLYPGF